MDQVKTFYKISQILSQAFKEVNDVCAHFMADQAIENSNHKPVQKKVTQQKPKQKSVPVHEPQQKKEPKIQPKKEVKVTAPQKPAPKPVQQQKKQTQSKPAQQNDTKNKGTNPERPKQPLSAFFIFQQQQKENVKKLHPSSSVTDVSKMMGEIWRGLQEGEKAPYIAKSQELKKQYEKELKRFYDKHPEQKSKKQLKKEKAQSKKQEQVKETPVVNNPTSKSARKPIVIEEENSESV